MSSTDTGGAGWHRVATAVAAEIPFVELDQVWLFPPVRREDREWGTAVVARRIDAHRRRVYTATYIVVTRGRARGEGRVTLDEVGDSPTVVVQDVIEGVQARVGDERPPEVVSPSSWRAYYSAEPVTEA